MKEGDTTIINLDIATLRTADTYPVFHDERIRELLRRKSPYIALLNSRGEFKALLDRQKLAALVGEAMVDG